MAQASIKVGVIAEQTGALSFMGGANANAAVNEVGSLRQCDVIAALDHAKVAEGPGGPAEMVPGQHHVRMNMYIAQARSGRFEIAKSLGAIDPQEAMVPNGAKPGRGIAG